VGPQYFPWEVGPMGEGASVMRRWGREVVVPKYAQWANRRVSRRTFLRVAGWSGAAFVLTGSRPAQTGPKIAASVSRPKRLATGAQRTNETTLEVESLPDLQARLSAETHDGVQVFKSRPDLAPPVIIVDVPASSAAVPGVVLTNAAAGPGQQGGLIIDRSGQLVWFFPASAVHNLQMQFYKGEPVLTWFQGVLLDGHGLGDYKLYDAAYREVTQVRATGGYQGDLHEFLLTKTGSALFTCYGLATADLSNVGGAKDGHYYYGVIQEVDVATGELLFQWRSDEHVNFDESYVPVATGSRAPWDYFHINSIDVDPADDNLIVSSRNTWTAYKIDRGSGAVLWRLGGKHSDFAMSPGTHFAFQHDVRRHPDGTVTLFDDEGGPPDEASQSRGLVLALDEQARAVEFIRQYHHSPPVLTQVLGSVQDLDDGHRFVGWGQSSDFTEYDTSGRAVFDGRLAPSTSSYRAFKQEWEGHPAEPPAIAVVAGIGKATVYASWNGATGLDQWSVLGGAHPDQLHALGVARCAGFETAITVPAPPSYLAVEAIDRAGAAVGRSQARAVISTSLG
jgi:Arylsulfotransferase (ASST)